MKKFSALPAIPADYPKLAALNAEEIANVRLLGYVNDLVDPAAAVQRAGPNNWDEEPGDDDIQNWKIRIYVIWFCYVYDNLSVINRPLYAIEELIREFKAPTALDTPGRWLGALYAGAHNQEPLSLIQLQHHVSFLRPFYVRGLALLENWLGAFVAKQE